ncbi:IS1595 family transposase [Parvularcula sp. LCG005]|uniref:IS1595 family transposase n=1 Tax=Parvularcula sp. LCG005 TaxID=3078805 RepID=UPI0029439E18|nr:IS1595 family transposase [Parvularcula sp. LCG005]WOI53710.1 IS1595 family transposase [Parvularcula sp. LCG005]
MSILSKPFFHDEAAAFEYLEGIVWGDEPVCPHCGCTGKIKKIAANPEKRVRHGLHRCNDCRRQFTVKVGTVFEHMRIPLHKALQAVYLMCASKKGVSAHQLHRILEVTYKTAWFLAHRIREAMRAGELAPFGGNGGDVQVDETFIGTDPEANQDVRSRNYVQKMKVLTLLDRETGIARSSVIDDLKVTTIKPIVDANIAKEARIVTDEAPRFKRIATGFAGHESVNHSADEYVRKDDPTVTTNHVENYFSVFKRGMKGTYQHCAKKHLHRYLAEFDFRYNLRSAKGVNDGERTEAALTGIAGKRLTYRSAC